MKINGREIHFKRTVKATCDIAELCPGGDIEKIESIFSGSFAEIQISVARFIAILSESYEFAKQYEDPDYEPHPLSFEEILYLDENQLRDLFVEATDAFKAGGKQKITTEPAAKKGEGKKKKK